LDVVGHEDEGVQCDSRFGTVVLKDLDEEEAVPFNLEEAAALRCNACDKEGADLLRGKRHREFLGYGCG
jgi:hypothetical protein